jgi:transcriptional regulator with XRE-family HTH domain
MCRIVCDMSIIDTAQRLRAPEFTLSDRLTKAREAARITQERMGELLGCSRRTIVRYEHGGAHVPRSVVLAYHVATQTDLEWLESGVASWCTPRDLNPEPTDSGSALPVPLFAARREKRSRCTLAGRRPGASMRAVA